VAKRGFAKFKAMRSHLFAGVFLALGTTPLFAQPQSTITVSAAASTKDVLTQLAKGFQPSEPDAKVNFNFGSSGTLRAQIEAGAPVDVFIAADDANMNALQKAGEILPKTRVVLARNRLVLVVPSDSKLRIRSFRDLQRADITRVAIGAPTVPAGARAQEVFEHLGFWPRVQAKAVRGKDVREVLAQVEAGNVEAGVVYATDAATTKRVRVVAIAPSSLHKPIRYPAAVLKTSRNPPLSGRFLAYISSRKARATWRAAGFLVP